MFSMLLFEVSLRSVLTPLLLKQVDTTTV